jgi:soluble lytic murein transglycosylase
VSARRTYSRRTYAATHAAGRRWLALVAAGLLAAAALAAALLPHRRVPQGSALPLADASVIRAQAHAKRLDPALIAAVIYAETKFDPRTSAAGALGLMQILPETARFIARQSGGTRFTTADLATPAVNVAYGSWYLRYLLDRYEDNEIDAVAAYNAGLANVDAWVAQAHEHGAHLSPSEIPFPETRAYVQRVLEAQREYRALYPRALGLA